MDDEPEIVMAAILSASLALVRPAGMSAADVEDWLIAAIDTLAHLPLHIFENGARTARGRCTHHSQIVPAILDDTREALAWHTRPKVNWVPRLVVPEQEAPRAQEPLPDPASMSGALQRMGLSRGWLVERDGRLEWSEDDVA
ncbi:hypothetical protein [Novosphingobium naphthalenivorans]|uniref:hypothetical protein n=1 Tax=Novosphingobium naphthalenivorans TaxID=273168 RepID=UPI000831428E|nr:hypothetical protein [Novosphingobium naphthalenivorans]